MDNAATSSAKINALTVTRMMASTQPAWFESLVVRRAYADLKFYGRIKAIVNRTADNHEHADFSDPVLGALYGVCEGYSTMLKRSEFDSGVNFNLVQALLVAGSTRGTLRAQDVPLAAARLQALCLSTPMDVCTNATDNFLVEWLIGKRVKRILLQQSMGQLTIDQGYEMQTLERKRILMALKDDETMRNFGYGLDNPPPEVPRLLTGYKAFDQATGGLGVGEATLVIAASGVGKTVIAQQLASQVCLKNPQCRVLFISTEEGHSQLERRIVSSTCNVKFDNVKDGLRLAEFTPAQRSAYNFVRGHLDSRLVIDKWERGISIRDGIKSKYDMARRKLGGHIDLVIFDWLGGTVSDDAKDSREKISRYQDAADCVALLAEEEATSTVAFAQGHPDTAINRLVVDASCLQSCKTMHNLYHNGIGVTAFRIDQLAIENAINTGTAHNLYQENQFYYMFKSRKSANVAIPVKRRTDFQRFEDRSYQAPGHDVQAPAH